jgi:hypothetical protein
MFFDRGWIGSRLFHQIHRIKLAVRQSPALNFGRKATHTENHPSASGILTESSPFAAAFYAYWLGHALCRHLWTV